MKNIELTPRLRMIGDMVREGVRVADVGTDHAFLPLYLVKSGKIMSAIASDINIGPIKNAERNIAEHQCQAQIKLVHCPGLDGVSEDDVDDVIVAGMGGELISAIIDAAAWLKSKEKQLILQPMSRANELRKYLCDNGFEIIEERIVREGKRLYTIISTKYSGEITKYDDVFLYVGRINPTSDEDAKSYILNQAEILKKAAEGMKKSDDEKEKAVKLFDLSIKIAEYAEGNR